MTTNDILERIKQLTENGDDLRAEPLILQLLSTHPDDPEIRLHYALLLSRLGRLNEALAQLKVLSKDYSQVPAVSINRADILSRMGRHDEAVEVLTQFTERRPRFMQARFNLARALNHAGKLDEAISEYRLALAHEPDHGEAWYRLGKVLLDDNRPDEAIDCFSQALERLPDMCQPKVVQQLRRAWKMQGHAVKESAPLWWRQPLSALFHGFVVNSKI
ncbi:hypothetical protein BGP77_02005 [Saccharospirillum sp. MSK14-1]|uniref:tetratricopeptide repeat protein n=1 Tax=Saccharospirillum sp. MSK14-1 TaxID=1897632 RepID=UPI000D33DFA8|nr:tetratricopeptide repeat protein [Saccharospirillum sp. MSK14-1]PTY36114.1 hypothetical protein BGP77_02005 [Saccharospirillum sp. MSK14-1]